MRPEEILRELRRRINTKSFLAALIALLKQLGAKLAYATLLLYYSYQSDATPTWAKRTILGSIAYLLAPIDVVPDLTPFLGFSDDFGVLMFGLVSIAGHVTEEIRDKSRKQIVQWFPDVTSDLFSSVDKKL